MSPTTIVRFSPSISQSIHRACRDVYRAGPVGLGSPDSSNVTPDKRPCYGSPPVLGLVGPFNALSQEEQEPRGRDDGDDELRLLS